MDLCIVAIFKNEGHALHEWIDHYLKEGVDKFFLVDNGSNDGYDIQEYIEKGIVELEINPKKHAQVELYNYYLKKAKQYKWVMVVDLDEFMYARNGYKTIKDYLRSIKPEVDQIKVPMKYFGSSGHIKQPKSIINGFTKRRYLHDVRDNIPDFTDVKSIVRGKSLIHLGVHVHQINNSIVITPKKEISILNIFETISEKSLKTCHLHLNHYSVQSWEFYKNVKMKRKSAYAKNGDKTKSKKTRIYWL